MRIEEVEIYADTSNAAIMRHPGRRFPGVLIQGDTLYSLYRRINEVCAAMEGKVTEDDYEEMVDIRDCLRAYVNHYKEVLTRHQIELPFYEGPNL